MEGTAGVRGLEADIDLSFSDILDHLDLALMSMLAARRGDWGLAGDAFWADLGAESEQADVDQKLSLLTVAGLRRINGFADVTFGARWSRVDLEVERTVPPELAAGRTEDWVDPVVGVILRTPGERRWHATLIADVGGFGVSSDLTWQAFPSAGFDMTKRSSVEVGWRVLDTDYETGEGASRFRYDARMQGPVLGFVFEF
jgi:hypothetical protein